MTCCGRRIGSSVLPAALSTRPAQRRVVFEYGGTKALTIYGRVTGIRYHFPGPGARVTVDARDAATLEVVRGLTVVEQAPRRSDRMTAA
jgi:hypothetical protein